MDVTDAESRHINIVIDGVRDQCPNASDPFVVIEHLDRALRLLATAGVIHHDRLFPWMDAAVTRVVDDAVNDLLAEVNPA